jgi:hypothetical protein
MNNDTITLYRTTRAIWYVAYVIEALLLLRFILRLLGANPGAGFTDLVYTLSSIPLAPFLYVFGNSGSGVGVIEWSVLLAMVVYWLIAWGIVKLVLMNHEVPTHEAERTLGQEERI